MAEGEGMMTEDDLIDEARALFLWKAPKMFAKAMDVGEDCESPIERVLLAALIAEAADSEGYMVFRRSIPEDQLFEKGAKDRAYVLVQQEIGGYRADFLVAVVEGDTTELLIVECDGHDYHDRTKEQARRDKKRDRVLAGLGHRVVRFTGSEIWANAAACAREIAKLTLAPSLRGRMRDLERQGKIS